MWAAASRAWARAGRRTGSPTVTAASIAATVESEQAVQGAQPHLGRAEVDQRDRLILLNHALVGQHPPAQPVGVELGDPLGGAEGGHGGQQRQGRHHRPAVGRVVVRGGPGCGAPVDVADRDQAVLGNEHVVDADVVEPVAHMPSVCQTSCT